MGLATYNKKLYSYEWTADWTLNAQGYPSPIYETPVDERGVVVWLKDGPVKLMHSQDDGYYDSSDWLTGFSLDTIFIMSRTAYDVPPPVIAVEEPDNEPVIQAESVEQSFAIVEEQTTITHPEPDVVEESTTIEYASDVKTYSFESPEPVITSSVVTITSTSQTITLDTIPEATITSSSSSVYLPPQPHHDESEGRAQRESAPESEPVVVTSYLPAMLELRSHNIKYYVGDKIGEVWSKSREATLSTNDYIELGEVREVDGGFYHDVYLTQSISTAELNQGKDYKLIGYDYKLPEGISPIYSYIMLKLEENIKIYLDAHKAYKDTGEAIPVDVVSPIVLAFGRGYEHKLKTWLAKKAEVYDPPLFLEFFTEDGNTAQTPVYFNIVDRFLARGDKAFQDAYPSQVAFHERKWDRFRDGWEDLHPVFESETPPPEFYARIFGRDAVEEIYANPLPEVIPDAPESEEPPIGFYDYGLIHDWVNVERQDDTFTFTFIGDKYSYNNRLHYDFSVGDVTTKVSIIYYDSAVYGKKKVALEFSENGYETNDIREFYTWYSDPDLQVESVAIPEDANYDVDDVSLERAHVSRGAGNYWVSWHDGELSIESLKNTGFNDTLALQFNGWGNTYYNLYVKIDESIRIGDVGTLEEFDTYRVVGERMVNSREFGDEVEITSIRDGYYYHTPNYTDFVVDADIITDTAEDATIFGTNADEVIRTGEGDDVLFGLAGDDRLYGESGDDTLNGNGGDDRLYGGDGDDTLNGDDGNDTLFGEEGDDTIYGGDGDDVLSGHNGDDTLYGGVGNDRLEGGADSDYLDGGVGNDKLYGEEGDDTLYGGVGNDRLEGGADSDYLDGGVGNDKLYGEEGDDTLYGGVGNDRLEGGSGDDKLDGGAGNDRLYGEEGDDTIYGGDGDDVLSGRAGNDTLYGGAGNDTLYGGRAGNDTLSGGAGDDKLFGGGDDDILDGGIGNDKGYFGYVSATTNLTLDVTDTTRWKQNADGTWSSGTGAGYEYQRLQVDISAAGDGTDIETDYFKNIEGFAITAGSGDDVLTGGGGNDILDGMGGNDILDGGAGTDVADFYYRSATADLTLDVWDNASTTYWKQDSNGDWTQTGATSADYQRFAVDISAAGDGTDIETDYFKNIERFIITAGAGNDVLSGHNGDDRLYGGAGNDVLSGHNGDDRLYGRDGNDELYGGAGIDMLVGGTGDDIFVLNLGGTSNDLDTVRDFVDGNNKIRVDTTNGNESNLAALKTAANIYWTNDNDSDFTHLVGFRSRFNDVSINDTIIYSTNGTEDTSDDFALMVLEDYATALTIADFDIV